MFFDFFIFLNWHATWQRHSCWHISDILSEILSGTVYGSDRAQKANKFATEWLSRGYWHTTWPRHVGKDARSGKWMSAVCVRVCVWIPCQKPETLSKNDDMFGKPSKKHGWNRPNSHHTDSEHDGRWNCNSARPATKILPARDSKQCGNSKSKC